jgi:integrase
MSQYTDASPDAFVVTGPEGGPLRITLWRQRQWKNAVVDARLAPLTPQDSRHTAVALWIASGANVLAVSRRAGHTSVAFTRDRHGHLFPQADASVANRLDEMVANDKTTRSHNDANVVSHRQTAAGQTDGGLRTSSDLVLLALPVSAG